MKKRRKGYVGRAMQALAGKTHTFICISDYVEQLVTGYGIPAAKCRLIHCSTNTAVKKEFPSSLREELAIDYDAPVVGTTGIWRPNKGFPYYIAAAEIINRWNPMVRFLLGGKAYPTDASFATLLWMRGSILRTSGVMKYTGFLEDIGKFMSALDVFVLPSECEPFGLVLIEAMARGIPVVATQAGGVPDIVTHGETGLLVPPRDPEALAEAINDLVCHPTKRMQMGETARAQVKEKFSRETMIKKYQEFYTEVVQEQ
ncbi:glycosyltransferase family 4 protein [bacterium]|nr:glycosyltransferase family 4 protein [bacterium]